MSAGWTQRHRDLLRAVSQDRIECDMTRGAWVGPNHQRRMGCYRWVGGDTLSLRDIEALIELRQAEQIVTVHLSGTDAHPVRVTPAGEAQVARWAARRAVGS